MPKRNGLAAGVNHALRPSKIPRNAPNNNPKTGLFICLLPGFYYDSARFPLTPEEEKKRSPHHQGRRNQYQQSPVPRGNTDQPLEPALLMGANRQMIKESRHVRGHLGDRLIPARRVGFGGPLDNRSEWPGSRNADRLQQAPKRI